MQKLKQTNFQKTIKKNPFYTTLKEVSIFIFETILKNSNQINVKI